MIENKKWYVSEKGEWFIIINGVRFKITSIGGVVGFALYFDTPFYPTYPWYSEFSYEKCYFYESLVEAKEAARWNYKLYWMDMYSREIKVGI